MTQVWRGSGFFGFRSFESLVLGTRGWAVYIVRMQRKRRSRTSLVSPSPNVCVCVSS